MAKAKKIVLIGDHKQLPPYVNSEEEIWEEIQKEAEDGKDESIEKLQKEYTKSLFETLIEELPDQYQTKLIEQRRMPKQIGDIVSKYFYEGELKTPIDEVYKNDKEIKLPLKKSNTIFVISTSNNDDRFDNGGSRTRENPCNRRVIKKTLQCLDNKLSEETTVAVIAGYRAQVEALEREKKREKKKYRWLKILGINTVDGFQGSESDIVIYDIVRSSRNGRSVGFLDEPRRLNVAFSRAKKLLLIVGDAEFVKQAKPTKNLNQKPKAEKALLGEIIEDIEEDYIVDKPEDIFSE